MTVVSIKIVTHVYVPDSRSVPMICGSGPLHAKFAGRQSSRGLEAPPLGLLAKHRESGPRAGRKLKVNYDFLFKVVCSIRELLGL